MSNLQGGNGHILADSMTIGILTHTIDSAGPTDTLVIFSLVGPDFVDGTYRVADFSELAGQVLDGTDTEAWISQWIIDNQATVNAAIDAGQVADSNTENTAKTRDLREEAKQFLADNPQAKAIIDLSGPALEAAIENRTEAQETLLHKTQAFAIRYLFESVRLLK